MTHQLLFFLLFTLKLLTVCFSEEDINPENENKNCQFQCSNPNETPFPIKPFKKYSSNGCGSGGIRIMSDPRIEPCCDVHDACYTVCGISRDYCDKIFKKCMTKKCRGDEQCIQSASVMTMGASLFGCDPFIKTQEESCLCIDNTNKNEFKTSQIEYLKHLYSSWIKKSKSLDEISSLIDKYGKDFNLLIAKLIRKYPKRLIVREKKSSEYGGLNMDDILSRTRPDKKSKRHKNKRSRKARSSHEAQEEEKFEL